MTRTIASIAMTNDYAKLSNRLQFAIVSCRMVLVGERSCGTATRHESVAL